MYMLLYMWDCPTKNKAIFQIIPSPIGFDFRSGLAIPFSPRQDVVALWQSNRVDLTVQRHHFRLSHFTNVFDGFYFIRPCTYSDCAVLLHAVRISLIPFLLTAWDQGSATLHSSWCIILVYVKGPASILAVANNVIFSCLRWDICTLPGPVPFRTQSRIARIPEHLIAPTSFRRRAPRSVRASHLNRAHVFFPSSMICVCHLFKTICRSPLRVATLALSIL